MSKAKTVAFEYAKENGTLGLDYNQIYDAVKYGYKQAEEDLELTWEDIKKIHTFLYAVKNNKQGAFTFTRLSDEKYQEVLKRFQNYKERNNNGNN